jgi:hypothetical protein
MTTITRSITLPGSDSAKRLRFRLVQHVVEDVIDGHGGGFGPFLRNLIVGAVRRLKRRGLISKPLLKLTNPDRVGSSPLLCQLEIHTGRDKLERFRDSRNEFRRDLKDNFGHLQSLIKAVIQARRHGWRESGAIS